MDKDTFDHKLPSDINMLHGRHPFIVDKCKGKCVLHIGCVDSGIMEQRFITDDLLHQKLDKEYSLLWGIDIDEEGLEFLRNAGFDKILYANIEKESDLAPLKNIKFDIIILSEVIEHLPNIGLALNALKTLATSDHTEFLISVPNAFSLPVLEELINNNEVVHPDHNYYFSYTTFSTILRKLDYEVKNKYMYTFQPLKSLPAKTLQSLITNSPATTPHEKGFIIGLKRIYWSFLARGANNNSNTSILKRLVTRWLFNKSAFWAEGIMFVCTTHKPSDN